ncbi:hypothetical protein PILCRDRAFT_4950 [Piloderma croceum F 1598]|uniref:Uncharacterized protein n=1 Tax=Piloderma croceum (strain F 1598) TaxID=765440 RepID=A0A0C3FQQ9_PILCF|nr:hypothetical protein PILCRDRAFT_4950 [Piloderma croceum F 1598]
MTQSVKQDQTCPDMAHESPSSHAVTLAALPSSTGSLTAGFLAVLSMNFKRFGFYHVECP